MGYATHEIAALKWTTQPTSRGYTHDSDQVILASKLRSRFETPEYSEMSSQNWANPTQSWHVTDDQQLLMPHTNQHNSQSYSADQHPNGSDVSYAAAYIHPQYGASSPVPLIAELPAPMPPAPPTTTPSEQLKEDELLAHKLQQLEVADARRRSSSAVSSTNRPVSMATLSPQPRAPLLHQRSAQSLRPHSQSLSSLSVSEPWSPGSFGSPTGPMIPSTLPEVVVPPRPVSALYHPSSDENLPIPVVQEHGSLHPVAAPLNPSSPAEYLEQHRQAPYPPQWTPPPVVATLYAYQGSKITPGSSWLDTLESCSWRSVRPMEHASNPAPTSYAFTFKSSSGGSFRSPKHSWIMRCPEGENQAGKSKKPTWAYDLKLEAGTGMRKSEVLSHGKVKAILTTYVHALNYDSLRFIGPDGRAYMWVTNSRVSSIDGSRYDTLRHALFVATGNILDPLYGEIVADHTFWDGYVDEAETHIGIRCDGCQAKPIAGLRWKCRICARHDICNTCRLLAQNGQFGASIQPTCDFSLVNLPDEALYLRSPTIDKALVVATLQILKDWEKHTLRAEKRKNIKEFTATEDAARRCDLGVMSYWKAGDWDKKSVVDDRHGTRVKAMGTMDTFASKAGALPSNGEAAFGLAGLGPHGSGGVDSGGGGHGEVSAGGPGAGGGGGGGSGS